VRLHFAEPIDPWVKLPAGSEVGVTSRALNVAQSLAQHGQLLIGERDRRAAPLRFCPTSELAIAALEQKCPWAPVGIAFEFGDEV
jgi:hypothetical protein